MYACVCVCDTFIISDRMSVCLCVCVCARARARVGGELNSKYNAPVVIFVTPLLFCRHFIHWTRACVGCCEGRGVRWRAFLVLIGMLVGQSVGRLVG